MIKRFMWTMFDVSTLMPESWSTEIISVARSFADDRILLPRHSSSREGDPNLRINVATVDGHTVRQELPWLYNLYHTEFRYLAQQVTNERISTAKNDLYGVVLNVQRGKEMRYEAHVDTNPLQGMLYATTHTPGSGGEMVVSNRIDSNCIDEIDADCSILYPTAGHIVFFDARMFPHYVRNLNSSKRIRIAAAMNFYTDSCSEEARPPDLSRHLAGYDV